MTPNTNPKTGIRYGCVSLAQLDQEQFDPWEDGHDVSCDEWRQELEAQTRGELADEGFDSDYVETKVIEAIESADYYQDEPRYASKANSTVKWEMFWLGGAPHLMVLESHHTDLMAECSPCVPRAGDIGTTGETRAYTVPPEWLRN